jgi:hypothetical protein
LDFPDLGVFSFRRPLLGPNHGVPTINPSDEIPHSAPAVSDNYRTDIGASLTFIATTATRAMVLVTVDVRLSSIGVASAPGATHIEFGPGDHAARRS